MTVVGLAKGQGQVINWDEKVSKEIIKIIDGVRQETHIIKVDVMSDSDRV